METYDKKCVNKAKYKRDVTANSRAKILNLYFFCMNYKRFRKINMILNLSDI